MVTVAEYRSAAAAEMSEADLQDQVITLARDLGWLLFHDRDSRMNQAGLPDLIMVRRGRLIMAELKKQNGKMRPAQMVWAQALNWVEDEAGGAFHAFAWRPADLLSGAITAVLR